MKMYWIESGGKRFRVAIFKNIVNHEDWHKVEELSMVRFWYDCWENEILFCNIEDKEELITIFSEGMEISVKPYT